MDSSYRFVKFCLIAASVSFVSTGIICVLLRPDLLFSNPHRGISHYATLWPTAIPYTIGIVGGAACLLMIAHRLRLCGDTLRTVRLFFTVFGNLLLVALLTPVTAGGVVATAHMVTAACLLLTQLILVIWVLRQPDKSGTEIVLAAASIASILFVILASRTIALVGPYMLGELLAVVTSLAMLGSLTLRRLVAAR